MTKLKLGGVLKKGKLDPSDPTYPVATGTLPPVADLRAWCQPAYLQWHQDCIEHTDAGIARFLTKRAGKPDFMPSRMQHLTSARSRAAPAPTARATSTTA